MTRQSKLESGIIVFGRVRRWLVAIFGVYVAGKGVHEHQWMLVALGAAIVVYGLCAPT
ncbi:MAG TPA: hypothetical protein VFE08_11225 [Candidatus Sulfotelmatobacter sp.]|jgi:hypothetical protein|nr:hypothetical protein [Candidatus Sulfotelmatobacter sp.]